MTTALYIMHDVIKMAKKNKDTKVSDIISNAEDGSKSSSRGSYFTGIDKKKRIKEIKKSIGDGVKKVTTDQAAELLGYTGEPKNPVQTIRWHIHDSIDGLDAKAHKKEEKISIWVE